MQASNIENKDRIEALIENGFYQGTFIKWMWTLKNGGIMAEMIGEYAFFTGEKVCSRTD